MDATSPEPDLGMLSGQLLRALQEELFQTLGQQGHPDVRPRHGMVLAFLDPEGVRATDLAARSGQHKQIIGTIVDELVSLGYVRREPDPADRRAKRIVPTERGLDEVARARAILAAIEHRLSEALGEQRFAAFREAFREVTCIQRGWRSADTPPI